MSKCSRKSRENTSSRVREAPVSSAREYEGEKAQSVCVAVSSERERVNKLGANT